MTELSNGSGFSDIYTSQGLPLGGLDCFLVVFGANVCLSRRKVVILQQIRKKDVRYQKDKGGFPHTVEGGL